MWRGNRRLPHRVKSQAGRPNPIGRSSIVSLAGRTRIFPTTGQMPFTEGGGLLYACALRCLMLQIRFSTRGSYDPSPYSLELHNVNAE